MPQDAPLKFLEHPILNSPYAYPGRHWELGADGQPTNKLIEPRRRSDLITPVRKAKKRKAPKCPTAQVVLELTIDHRGLRTLGPKCFTTLAAERETPGCASRRRQESRYCTCKRPRSLKLGSMAPVASLRGSGVTLDCTASGAGRRSLYKTTVSVLNAGNLRAPPRKLSQRSCRSVGRLRLHATWPTGSAPHRASAGRETKFNGSR